MRMLYSECNCHTVGMMHHLGAVEEVEIWSVLGSALSQRPPFPRYTTPLSCLEVVMGEGQEGKHTLIVEKKGRMRNLNRSKGKDVTSELPYVSVCVYMLITSRKRC